MAVYRPKYRDPVTNELKESAVYWYEFVRDGTRHRGSTGVENKRVAENIEAAEKTNIARGAVGIAERPTVPTLKEFSVVFMKQIELDCASKPASGSIEASWRGCLRTESFVSQSSMRLTRMP